LRIYRLILAVSRTGMFDLPGSLSHVTSATFAQAWLGAEGYVLEYEHEHINEYLETNQSKSIAEV
jgi:hypothetical protein